jgi:exopolyphosphatase/guanosine-5'-triphosphate,3'-diphosphate pyrophosphatase
MLLQVIDIGTNSVRSIVVKVPVGGPYEVIDEERDMTSLGEGLELTGALQPGPIERTMAALRAMRHIGGRLGVDRVRAVATEAVRRATNGAEFVGRAQNELGLQIDVIPPEEEGRLVWLSAASQVKATDFSVVIDIGGGSVEIVQATDGSPSAITSVRLGARVITERFVTEDPASPESFKALRRHVRKTLRAKVTPLSPAAPSLVGSGGTVTSIAAIVAALRGRRYESLHGVEFTRAELTRVVTMLAKGSLEQRLKIPGMPVDRADIMLAGAVVLAETMALFSADSVLVNARGIRHGIIIDTLAREGATEVKPDLQRAVRDVATRYRYNRAHAEQVTRLALSMFDQLEEPLGLDPETRPLLESAAMLHDIGYFIAYERHNEHSYHLILHSSLAPLTRRELGIVASVARYHTKALPKARHESWSSIDPEDRPTVRALASVLRLADGLDRGGGEHVEGVRVADDGTTTRLFLRGAEDLTAELYGVEKKRDLFEETFGRHVVAEGDTEGGTHDR